MCPANTLVVVQKSNYDYYVTLKTWPTKYVEERKPV